MKNYSASNSVKDKNNAPLQLPKFERVYVEIGNICNLRCPFCAGTKKPKKQMSEMEFSHVCKEIKQYTKQIYFHVMGEPLLHPLVEKFLMIAEENGLKVNITTNGTLIAKKKEILLKNANILHKISISLHSFEGNNLEDFYQKLSDIAEFAREIAGKGVFVIMRLWNRDSEEERGINKLNDKIESFLHSNFKGEWQKRAKGFRLDKYIILEYDGVFAWPTLSKAIKSEKGSCYGIVKQLGILADGSVVPCCLDCNGEINLGNIFSQELKDILQSKRAKDMVLGFNRGEKTEELCKKCTFVKKFKIRNN